VKLRRDSDSRLEAIAKGPEKAPELPQRLHFNPYTHRKPLGINTESPYPQMSSFNAYFVVFSYCILSLRIVQTTILCDVSVIKKYYRQNIYINKMLSYRRETALQGAL